VSRLVVVGDVLLDRDLEGDVERLCPEAPVPVVEDLVQQSRPGGAGLAAALAAGDGHEVVLVTALADDDGGAELRTLLAAKGVELLDLGLAGATPEKVRVRHRGRLLIRLDYGGRAGDVGAARTLPAGDAVLVADYGRGVADRMRLELARAALSMPLVWDPHPRGGEPVPAATLVTPNLAEAKTFVTDCYKGAPAAAEVLRRRWAAQAVAVTLGEEGAVLAREGSAPVRVACAPAPGGDPCGAGDRFASAAAAALGGCADLVDAVMDACERAAAFVAAGGAGALATELATDCYQRPSRGTVVATGGCFDLLHAGHVALLQQARALGDHLVVLLNSDESVRRLKGLARPLVGQDDRAAVLRALACVDEVVVFDGDTPEAALARLRPDVWVKGGDYDADELPEAAVVRRHGGRVEIVPYVDGRSTTRLIREAALRAV
jgi:D-beta-D-heptose 7-phosphate kinase / D-beta-D-heptose 1-phosphate adenosyltransferase